MLMPPVKIAIASRSSVSFPSNVKQQDKTHIQRASVHQPPCWQCDYSASQYTLYQRLLDCRRIASGRLSSLFDPLHSQDIRKIHCDGYVLLRFERDRSGRAPRRGCGLSGECCEIDCSYLHQRLFVMQNTERRPRSGPVIEESSMRWMSL